MKVPQTDIRNSSLFQSHMEKNHTFAIFFELLDNNKCTIVRNLAIFTEAFVSSRCFLTNLEDSLSHKQTHTDTSTQPPQHYKKTFSFLGGKELLLQVKKSDSTRHLQRLFNVF